MSIYGSLAQQEERDRIHAMLGPKKGKKPSASSSLTVGIYDKEMGGLRNSGMKKGLPDVIGIYKGQFIGVEIKIGKDRQSDYQKEREQEINEAGGLYFIAKTFDQIKPLLDVVFTKVS